MLGAQLDFFQTVVLCVGRRVIYSTLLSTQFPRVRLSPWPPAYEAGLLVPEEVQLLRGLTTHPHPVVPPISFLSLTQRAACSGEYGQMPRVVILWFSFRRSKSSDDTTTIFGLPR